MNDCDLVLCAFCAPAIRSISTERRFKPSWAPNLFFRPCTSVCCVTNLSCRDLYVPSQRGSTTGSICFERTLPPIAFDSVGLWMLDDTDVYEFACRFGSVRQCGIWGCCKDFALSEPLINLMQISSVESGKSYSQCTVVCSPRFDGWLINYLG